MEFGGRDGRQSQRGTRQGPTRFLRGGEGQGAG